MSPRPASRHRTIATTYLRTPRLRPPSNQLPPFIIGEADPSCKSKRLSFARRANVRSWPASRDSRGGALSRRGTVPEQHLPDLLEHGGVRLHLLGDRVNVAKA